MPPWFNKWLVGAMVLSMTLHFVILEVDFLAVSSVVTVLRLLSSFCCKFLLSTEIFVRFWWTGALLILQPFGIVNDDMNDGIFGIGHTLGCRSKEQ